MSHELSQEVSYATLDFSNTRCNRSPVATRNTSSVILNVDTLRTTNKQEPPVIAKSPRKAANTKKPQKLPDDNLSKACQTDKCGSIRVLSYQLLFSTVLVLTLINFVIWVPVMSNMYRQITCNEEAPQVSVTETRSITEKTLSKWKPKGKGNNNRANNHDNQQYEYMYIG